MNITRPQSVTTRQISLSRLNDLAALLDVPPLDDGCAIPPLWHWAAISQQAPTDQLQPDGHPRSNSLGVPPHLPRRMYGGGRVTFHAPIRPGEQVVVNTGVQALTTKTGRSGELCIVDVATTLSGSAGETLLEEVQQYIYRAQDVHDPSVALATPPAEVGEPDAPLLDPTGSDHFAWSLHTDSTVLTRFSAATANSHRIHYDWPYATQVEQYPGLVVHGPLMSVALAEVFRRTELDCQIESLVHRNLAPLWCGEPARTRRLEGSTSDGRLTLGLFSGPDFSRLCSTLELHF